METIARFVARTRGPVVPFVDDWYPWAYAHHYLRTEMENVSPELGPGRLAARVDDAVAVIRRWCAVTGEDIDDAVRLLADAYLERWGLTPPGGRCRADATMEIPVLPRPAPAPHQAPSAPTPHRAESAPEPRRIPSSSAPHRATEVDETEAAGHPRQST